ncbi:uncharacterized protein ACIBXB_020971 [Morphnus guianensis]
MPGVPGASPSRGWAAPWLPLGHPGVHRAGQGLFSQPKPRGVRSRGKTAQADMAGESLLQELVAARLEEQLTSRRHKITSWLRRFLLFLAFLQIAILILVLLKRDILNGVLPPKLADAFGSCPVRSQFS